ncbi:hypothetical protein BB561_001512 [Smittium simulii]|uniref:1,4-alpha-glucan-branching enzyme n=1 Tax=Smittium simulii TaxID=133385 RepID=A0A2T9YUE7_9FUNG|nr:hypothetical protein BB561_001512 [Smittium simulii]
MTKNISYSDFQTTSVRKSKKSSRNSKKNSPSASQSSLLPKMSKTLSGQAEIDFENVNKAQLALESILKSNPDQEELQVLKLDSYLKPHEKYFTSRYAKFVSWLQKIQDAGGIDAFSKAYTYFGFNVTDSEIIYREWAPNASSASLVGDFNNWDVKSHPLSVDEFGVWSIKIPHVVANNNKIPAIKHNSKVKIFIISKDDTGIYRLPAWSKYVTQDLNVSPVYDSIFYNPDPKDIYKKVNKRLPASQDLRIYEVHVGISTPDPRVGTYKEFTKNVLPKIKDLGYNTIQLMAIMEHAYYASFGYQVTSFFAASSRYGNPEDLKELIDVAHGMGISVFLDVVHSHASNNIDDGLNEFDGSDNCYFHEGPKGRHELWNSRLFHYGSFEVMRFLMSNLRYWVEEFGFDGFRFDGVSSMIYQHHGIGVGFSGDYNEYFSGSTDDDAIMYLMIANFITHALYPGFVTIAEDVSGMPALCRPVSEGGVGFDYRLGMSIPDMWIKLLKETRDEEWNIGYIDFQLTNRRHTEKTITYCESHDQALVGDKTIAFWLMDKEMYTNMSDLTELTPVIDRGVSLHKMIRLVTFALGGEGYLTFVGNEFGHPEWLDFPREGNQSSFHYARRQFNLVDDELLRYKYLYRFDKAINNLEAQYKWLTSNNQFTSLKHESDKLLVFERGDRLLWIFNFHPVNSYPDYTIGVSLPGTYSIILNSDDKQFLGHGRVEPDTKFITSPIEQSGRPYSIKVYIPSRSALVLRLQ